MSCTSHRPEAALRILIIDDHEDAADSLSMLCRVQGHEVRTAYRGTTGLELFRQFQPDAILCDLRMPEMSGFEVARRVRATSASPAPLLVAVSGYGSDAHRAASSAAGFDHHFTKPVDPGALFGLLRETPTQAPRDSAARHGGMSSDAGPRDARLANEADSPSSEDCGA
ncbi:MAG TPA: response regulator [Planctomycetota bacterium]|nr:response regulator [Planctomycetota bacterium]